MNRVHAQYQTLTETEKKIYHQVVEHCFDNKVIAYTNSIAISTVKSHMRNIFDKMLVNNRCELIRDYYKYVNNCNDNTYRLELKKH